MVHFNIVKCPIFFNLTLIELNDGTHHILQSSTELSNMYDYKHRDIGMP